MPGATESAHNRHPDFRVGPRIFATLGYPDADWAMVKLPPEMQEMYVTAEPAVFTPVKGAWGRRGSTNQSGQGKRAVTVVTPYNK